MKAAFGPYTVRIGKSLAPSKWLVGASYWKQGYTAPATAQPLNSLLFYNRTPNPSLYFMLNL